MPPPEPRSTASLPHEARQQHRTATTERRQRRGLRQLPAAQRHTVPRRTCSSHSRRPRGGTAPATAATALCFRHGARRLGVPTRHPRAARQRSSPSHALPSDRRPPPLSSASRFNERCAHLPRCSRARSPRRSLFFRWWETVGWARPRCSCSSQAHTGSALVASRLTIRTRRRITERLEQLSRRQRLPLIQRGRAERRAAGDRRVKHGRTAPPPATAAAAPARARPARRHPPSQTCPQRSQNSTASLLVQRTHIAHLTYGIHKCIEARRFAASPSRRARRSGHASQRHSDRTRDPRFPRRAPQLAASSSLLGHIRSTPSSGSPGSERGSASRRLAVRTWSVVPPRVCACAARSPCSSRERAQTETAEPSDTTVRPPDELCETEKRLARRCATGCKRARFRPRGPGRVRDLRSGRRRTYLAGPAVAAATAIPPPASRHVAVTITRHRTPPSPNR